MTAVSLGRVSLKAVLSDYGWKSITYHSTLRLNLVARLLIFWCNVIIITIFIYYARVNKIVHVVITDEITLQKIRLHMQSASFETFCGPGHIDEWNAVTKKQYNRKSISWFNGEKYVSPVYLSYALQILTVYFNEVNNIIPHLGAISRVFGPWG